MIRTEYKLKSVNGTVTGFIHENDENKDGRTAFLVACFYGNIDAAKLLLEKGANLYAKNKVRIQRIS